MYDSHFISLTSSLESKTLPSSTSNCMSIKFIGGLVVLYYHWIELVVVLLPLSKAGSTLLSKISYYVNLDTSFIQSCRGNS